MGGELIVAMYTVLLSDEWDIRLPNTLKRRILTYNYSMPQRFEYDLDIIHKQVINKETNSVDMVSIQRKTFKQTTFSAKKSFRYLLFAENPFAAFPPSRGKYSTLNSLSKKVLR
jgi:hypothetical protein